MDLMKIVANKEIEHVYQPLWNLNDWNIHGYEVLARFPSTLNKNIESIFDMAGKQGILFELDTLSLIEGVKSFPLQLLGESRLFINIFPSTLLHPKFEQFIMSFILEYPEIQGKLVLELNESSSEEHLWNLRNLKEKISMLKKFHILIALDDIGKGAATMQKALELSPNYIKLDRSFANDLSNSKENQEQIALIVSYCQNNIQLVLEGIEKDIDLAWAEQLHVPIVQGYLLGRPKKISYTDLLLDRKKITQCARRLQKNGLLLQF